MSKRFNIMKKLSFGAFGLQKYCFISAIALGYSASCEKPTPPPQAPHPVTDTISKEEEERLRKERKMEEDKETIRTLSINNTTRDLTGDDNTIKNGQLFASVLVDAAHFLHENSSKFKQINDEAVVELLGKKGFLYDYSFDSYKKFFKESLAEKNLHPSFIETTLQEYMKLLTISIIKDAAKRKEEVKNYSDILDKNKVVGSGGNEEVLLLAFQQALNNPNK